MLKKIKMMTMMRITIRKRRKKLIQNQNLVQRVNQLKTKKMKKISFEKIYWYYN